MKKGELAVTCIAFIYFFVNATLLPMGLLYTTFLTPFFYIYLVRKGSKNVLGYFLLAAIPWVVSHFIISVNEVYYLKSLVMVLTVYIFICAFYVYLKTAENMERLFARIAVVNFILVLIALVLFWTDYKPAVWYLLNLNTEIKEFPRLKLFTYEPSYYSTLLVPIAVFYFLTALLKPQKIKVQLFMLLIIAIPLTLSFSLGVMSGLAFAFSVFIVYYYRHLLKQRLSFYNLTSIAILTTVLFLALVIFYPSNPLFERVFGIFEGKDTSAKGRTIEAIMLSLNMLDFCNYWLGCGLGQIKVIGEIVVREYYHYQKDDIVVIRIPSAIGETLTYFGIIGVITRFFVLGYLYIKTRVYTNYYRFILFWYMFLYQFTGSYITNAAEYVVWVFAFTPHFSQFNVPKRTKNAVS